MTKTELLALAERLDAHAAIHEAEFPTDEDQQQWAADLRAQAALNRKLAALEPIGRVYDESLRPVAAYNLTGIIDHE